MKFSGQTHPIFRTKLNNNTHGHSWVILLVALGFVAVAFFLWLALATKERAIVEGLVGLELDRFKAEASRLIESRIRTLVRLASRWEIQEPDRSADWQRDMYLREDPLYESIAWIDSSSSLRWIMPPEKDRQLPELSGRVPEAVTILPTKLSEDETGLLLIVPLVNDGTGEGLVAGFLSPAALVGVLLDSRSELLQYSVAIHRGNQQVFLREDRDKRQAQTWEQEVHLDLFGTTWTVRIWPGPELIARSDSNLPELVLIVGILIAILIAVLARRGQKAKLRVCELELTNRGLKTEVGKSERAVEAIKRSENHFRTLIENVLDIITTLNGGRAPVRKPITEKSRDLSDRIISEFIQALRDSEQRYRRFFEEDLTGDFIATPDGRIIACNPAFARIFGFDSVQEATRANVGSFYPDPQALQAFLGLVREEKKIEYFEAQLRRRDGRPVYVVANLVGTFDSQGLLIEIKGYIFDDTNRKKLEEQFRHAQKMEAIGRLAGGVAHDFNNLLTGISGYTQLALSEIQPESALNRDLHQIGHLAESARRLTRRLLAFSRRQTLQPVTVNLNNLIESTSHMLQRLLQGDIEVSFNPSQDIGDVQVDPGQIEQILLNLALNARDAMPHGGKLMINTESVILDTNSHAASCKPGAGVMISVSDTGEGMDEETRERIFEPFFTTKESGKGTGLGLASVYGIVNQHLGHISVESELRKGTTFKIYLPCIDSSWALATQMRRAAGGS